MKNLFRSLLFIIIALKISAQNKELATALLIDESEIANDVLKTYHERCLSGLVATGTTMGNVRFYDWNGKNSSVKFSTLNKQEEKPSNIIIFLKPTGSFNLNPPLIIKTDSTGKTISGYFELKGEMTYNCKHIDVATAEVLKNQKLPIIKPSIINVEVPNLVKEFGGDPNLINRKNSSQYNQLLKNLVTKYQNIFIEHYFYRAKNTTAPANSVASLNSPNNFYDKASVDANISFFSSNVFESSQESFKVLASEGEIDKKTKRIRFSGTKNDNLVKGDSYKVLLKKAIDDYHYYEDVVTVYVDEIGEQESLAKTLLFSSKDLSAALTSKDELLLVKEDNISALNKLSIRPGEKKVFISVKKECLFCKEALEAKLSEIPVVGLIERNAPELNYFNNLSKDERFIDYSIENLQGKKVGYQILLSENGKFIDAIETETNKNLISIEKNSFGPQIGISGIQRILTAFNSELYKVVLVKVLEQKKEKVDKIAAYHATGLAYNAEYVFYNLQEEDVDGEKIFRKVTIGVGKVVKEISPNISEINLKKGEKEVFKAIKEGKKLLIEISDKSGN